MEAPANSQPQTTPSFAPVSFEATDEASGASRRLRALAALSGSLTDALSPRDAVDLVEQKALSALDATSAIVITLGAFPPVVSEHTTGDEGVPPFLHVVHAIGLPAELTATLEALPLGAPVPFAEVARSGTPLFMPSSAQMRQFPDWSTSMIRAGAHAAAIVPVWANGELRGVLGLTWASPRIFDEDERAFVSTLGVMCAQAIMRAHLRAAERVAREQAEAARAVAETANLSKARFVATISHELRTPMNAVLGYASLLADEISGPLSQLQKDQLGRVRSSGRHLLGLVEDLLGFARIEAGEETVRPEPVMLLDIIEQSLVLVRPRAESKRLHIRVEGPETPVELYTDPRKLRQILVNLIANAVKFTDAGDVVVVFRVDGSDDETRVFFLVTDTGRGISSENQAHVFEPFWQADPTATQPSGSSGLGLSVARELARLLGGDVRLVRSVPGEGTTFEVSLPARYKGWH